ncbi:hypothetical protein ABGB07_00525 [Micromonosporaceae bacterium B7E4]
MTQNAEWQTGSEPAEWTWDEPDPGWHAPCRRLEATGLTSPLDRADLAGIGVTGIQFGSWDGRDPGCLDTDVIGLVAGDTRTEPGRVYRVGGCAYFVRLDASDPLPLADGCLDWAYAEHFIEHLTLAEGIGWPREVRRILAVGGWLRLTTPDPHRYVAGYLDDGADGFFARHRRRLISLGAKPGDLPGAEGIHGQPDLPVPPAHVDLRPGRASSRPRRRGLRPGCDLGPVVRSQRPAAPRGVEPGRPERRDDLRRRPPDGHHRPAGPVTDAGGATVLGLFTVRPPGPYHSANVLSSMTQIRGDRPPSAPATSRATGTSRCPVGGRPSRSRRACQ